MLFIHGPEVGVGNWEEAEAGPVLVSAANGFLVRFGGGGALVVGTVLAEWNRCRRDVDRCNIPSTSYDLRRCGALFETMMQGLFGSTGSPVFIRKRCAAAFSVPGFCRSSPFDRR